MDNICIDCRKSADCKRKPRTDQWTVAGCSWFEADTVITNADRIRSMTDEDLVDKFILGVATYVCPPNETIKGSCIEGKDCRECWLDWLKSPVEVDNVCTD